MLKEPKAKSDTDTNSIPNIKPKLSKKLYKIL